MAPSRMRQAAAKLDMYRKVPVDLMEGTRRGSLLSYMALFTIVTLFLLETKAFFSERRVTDLALDDSIDPRIRVNFNITMLDLKCEWAVIDVVSALGTDQNVTSHVSKWQVDAKGARQAFGGYNRIDEILLKDDTVTESIEQLHQNGEDAVSLDEQTLQFARNENDYLFVDFYASWCNHCRDLAPTWEALAELMLDAGEKLGNQHPDHVTERDYEIATKVEVPVMIAKVDCVTHPNLCNIQEDIRAYPTLRLFVDGERWKGGDYRGHRTLIEMVDWLYRVEMDHKEHMDESERRLHAAHQAARERLGEDGTDEEKRWHNALANERNKKKAHWEDSDHPGCIMSGHLLVDRTPGNFHIQARSQNQEFAAHMTNVSHVVSSLYVGDPSARMIAQGKSRRGNAYIPPQVVGKIAPIDETAYVTQNLHESYHHYLKLIPTQIEGIQSGTRQPRLYQMLASAQLAYYRNDMIPEAKFIYDLSPIAVSYRAEYRRWYDYCTSIMAIIGGVFTVVGMLESSIHATVTHAQKRRSTAYRR